MSAAFQDSLHLQQTDIFVMKPGDHADRNDQIKSVSRKGQVVDICQRGLDPFSKAAGDRVLTIAGTASTASTEYPIAARSRVSTPAPHPISRIFDAGGRRNPATHSRTAACRA